MEQTLTSGARIEEVLEKTPLIISGPCSAETEEQVLQTATRLAKTGKVECSAQAYGNPEPGPEVLKALAQKDYPGCNRQKK